MTELQIIIISSTTATVTTILVEFIKKRIESIAKRKLDIEENVRRHDIELFKTLSSLLPEGILRGTMYSIKVNVEYYFDFINGMATYKIWVEDIEEGKFIDDEIEKAHIKYFKSLKELEKNLIEDFAYDINRTYKPKKEKDIKGIKEKYGTLTDKVSEDYTVFRKLIKAKFQI